jgi:nucleotide-binding universal stress UspA family protein
MAPLSGGPSDVETLAAATALAAPFNAEMAAVYAPADAAELMPWMGEGFMGGVQVAALDSLKEAAEIGARHATAHYDGVTYPKKTFSILTSSVATALALEARLSDVVAFGADPARGRGPLVESFQQVLMEERRPVFITRGGAPDLSATVAVAWDGGREATRAARIAIPWLQKAGQVVILAAPAATPRDFDPARLKEHFSERGVKAEVETLAHSGDPGPMLLSAALAAGAAMLVAGAFGHPRFQQFIFGGTTRHLMQAEVGPSLLLTH